MLPYIGDIVLWAGPRPPKGFLFCHGQALLIVRHQALYSVLLDTYGANKVSFNLPDLRGRVPVGVGSAFGVRTTQLAETFGSSAVATATGGAVLPGSVSSVRGAIGGQPESNVSPSFAINFAIAIVGLYPPREGDLR